VPLLQQKYTLLPTYPQSQVKELIEAGNKFQAQVITYAKYPTQRDRDVIDRRIEEWRDLVSKIEQQPSEVKCD